MRTTLALLRYALVLTTLVLLAGDPEGLFARSMAVPICEEVCTGSTECNTECYENMMEFENGNDITCYEYGTYDDDQFCCLDDVCNVAAEESCGNCVADCGPCLSTPTCGQFGCEQGENCESCPQDCGACGTSGGSCDYDDRCEDDEDEYCQDCQFTGFCEDEEDCPDFQGDSYKYVCVDDRCVLEDLPWVTNTCLGPANCPSGWTCTDIPENYHGSSYECPENQPTCKVCIPNWVQ
jgi:hypothetical protein